MTKKSVDGSVTSYVYNTEDRLSEVWSGGVGSGSLTARYYYDPFGRRLWKDVGGVRTYFHYADEGLVGEYDADGVEIKTYGYKPGSTWTTDPLFMKVGSQYYFYHTDHLGTPQKMTSVNGAVEWSAKYSSFGNATIEVGTVENNLRYAGQYFDNETKLHYNYHRYYKPEIGRYLTVDPIGIVSGVNHFEYAQNSPLRLSDPFGLYSDSVIPSFPGPSGTPRLIEREIQRVIRDIKSKVEYVIDEIIRPKSYEYCKKLSESYKKACYVRGTVVCKYSSYILNGPGYVKRLFNQVCVVAYNEACNDKYESNMKLCDKWFCQEGTN